MSQAIGILGGTFDPIHYGHLRLAQEMAERLQLLQVRFVPAGDPYHRPQGSSPARHRLQMVQLAVAGNDRFVVDARDVHRQGATYTYDTVSALRAELGAQIPLVLLLGEDAFALLHTWHRWQELLELTHFAVTERPGASAWRANVPTGLDVELRKRAVADAGELHQLPGGRIALVRITPLDISGSAIRAAIQTGKSARYLLPDNVLHYIHEQQLYAKGD